MCMRVSALCAMELELPCQKAGARGDHALVHCAMAWVGHFLTLCSAPSRMCTFD